MTYIINLTDLKKLLRNNLFLDLDSHALGETVQGLVCDFMDIKLTSVFQPIIATATGKVLGREALLRAFVKYTAASTADAAFERAGQARNLVQLDRLLRTLHLLNHARSYSEDGLLFLNVHPHLLVKVNDHGRVFEQILHYYSVSAERVVIEIAENAVADKQCLYEAVNNFRNVGYKVAIDNYLPSQSALGRVIKLRPDIVKLEGSLIRDAEHKGGKGGIYGLVDTFHGIGAKVVIQGIETPEQADIAYRAGADGLQGFYIGRPVVPVSFKESLCWNYRLAA